MENKETCDKFEEIGLFSYHPCEKCLSKVRVTTRKRNQDGKELITLRCTNSKYQKYRSITQGSFFSLFRKPVKLIDEAIKLWALQLPIKKATEFLAMNGSDITDFFISSLFKRLRNVCNASQSSKSYKLGGVGKFVEIDESLVAKAKYNKGKAMKRRQTWMFGIVERGTEGKAYVEIVKDRKGPT